VIFGHYWLPFGAPHSPLVRTSHPLISAPAQMDLCRLPVDGELLLDSAIRFFGLIAIFAWITPDCEVKSFAKGPLNHET
jgi:hypothetical protein